MLWSNFAFICVFLRYAGYVAAAAGSGDVGAAYCYKKSDDDRGAQTNRMNVGWSCETTTRKCSRTLAATVSHDECLYSLNICKLICDRSGSLWPLPTKKLDIKDELIPIDSGKISFKLDVPRRSNQLWNMLEELEQYFLNAIRPFSRVKNVGSELNIVLKLTNENVLSYVYDTAENYTLSVSEETSKSAENRVVVVVEGENYFGVRHGIETLSQLVVYDDFSKQLFIPKRVEIADEPAFKHRGLLLDTSRSFYSVKSIKRTLDAMAQNKLNTFHWHITDSHSFPFESKIYPQLTLFGAYSPSQVYSWSDIKEIVKYGKIRGIRVIPELDAPSHVGEGWQYFDIEQPQLQRQPNNVSGVVLCFKAEPWRQYCVEPPCGLLNPVNPQVYQILGNLYNEFNLLFDSDVFHMGGDEVSPYCWQNTPSVAEAMRKLSQQSDGKASEERSFLELWSHFQSKALEQLEKTAKVKNGRVILWTSSLTETANVTRYLDKGKYIIQIWTTISDKQIGHLLGLGYDVILSNYDALYFDCGFGAWIGEGNNWCSPYIGWQKVYANDPTSVLRYANLSEQFARQILGAEATLWSEQSDDSTLDSRLWPRASALAERLWSNPASGWKQAEARILTQRQRMLNRGIGSDVIEPLWCHQNQGLCY